MAVTAPWGLGHTHLVPLAIEFLEAYPEISLRLMLTDRMVNAAEEDIDIAIRVGTPPESSMIATRIGSIRIVVCGSRRTWRRGGIRDSSPTWPIMTASPSTTALYPPRRDS